MTDSTQLDLDRAARATTETLAVADELVSKGRILDAIDLLHQSNLARRQPDLECRLSVLRNAAFDSLVAGSRFPDWPVPIPEVDRDEPAQIPHLLPADLTAERVRRAMLSHGSVHVPGLLNAPQVQTFVDGIDLVLGRQQEGEGAPLEPYSSWISLLPLPQDQMHSLGRTWVAGGGGILACDSPRLLELIFATYESVGLRELVTEYLGERPALSANKATLRRTRLDGKADWHQDGAFLGTGIRALNVWIALTDCGVDAPGLDIVPRRFDEVQETGTGGAIFDWAVGSDVVERLAVEAPVVRPHFKAGDAMLFDELLLHRTAIDSTMTLRRHAIESWFFAPSSYPDGQVPLVW